MNADSSVTDKRNKSYFIYLDETNQIKNKPELSTKYHSLRNIPNTSVFLVSVNDIPLFYCRSRKEAVNKSTAFLDIKASNMNCKYYIENIDDFELYLTSIDNNSIIKTETVEHVVKITEIKEVGFMVE
jgi:hypothetical protein